MVSKASEDFPEPERPVITTSRSRGISTSTFLRLCSRAPRTAMTFELGGGANDVIRLSEQRKNSLFHASCGLSTATEALGIGFGMWRAARPRNMGSTIEYRNLPGIGQFWPQICSFLMRLEKQFRAAMHPC